jgi:hypothetical protein
MKVPSMELTPQPIKYNLKNVPATQRIEQKPANMQIEQPAAILEINTTKGEFQIDAEQFWGELGFKKPGVLMEEYANKGKEEILSGIARRVQEGRQLMLNAGKGQGAKTIQSIAKQNTGAEKPVPSNIKFIPSYQSIKVQFTPGEVNIDVQRNQPKINVEIQKPVHEYTPGDVQMEILQYPSLKIDWTV